MKYLKLFENFEDFPDVFQNNLARGVRHEIPEYIDDPSTRRVNIGLQGNQQYDEFAINFVKVGLQNPLQSVHMAFKIKNLSDLDYFGKKYKIIPHRNAKFSFNREYRNGGLGSTYWYTERTIKDFSTGGQLFVQNPKMTLEQHLSKQLGNLSEGLENDLENLYSLSYFDEQAHQPGYYTNLITGYQNWLIDAGVIGNITYQELLDISNDSSNNERLQLWTESPCKHILIKKEVKVATPKKEVLLTKDDFESRGVVGAEIARFWKENGSQMSKVTDKQEALSILDNWIG